MIADYGASLKNRQAANEARPLRGSGLLSCGLAKADYSLPARFQFMISPRVALPGDEDDVGCL